MDLKEIVMKLAGPIQPVGCSHEDAKRLQNLGAIVDLTAYLLIEILDASDNANQQEASVRAIGQYALDALTTWDNMLLDKGIGNA